MNVCLSLNQIQTSKRWKRKNWLGKVCIYDAYLLPISVIVSKLLLIIYVFFYQLWTICHGLLHV
jgi:hypothetical protein